MKFASLLFAIMSLICVALGQDRPATQGQPNTVLVSADGKFETSPDTALVQFNISAQEDKSAAAYDRASKAAEQIRQILRGNGIDPKAAEISSFSIQPVYDYRQPKAKLVAYQVNASVSLKVRDFSKIAPIIQQLSEADITANQSVSYTLENVDTAKTKAVEDAFRRARDSANAVASAGGRTLGELSYASVDTYENIRISPVMHAMAKMGTPNAAPAPTEEFSPQLVTVTAHVQTVFTMK